MEEEFERPMSLFDRTQLEIDQGEQSELYDPMSDSLDPADQESGSEALQVSQSPASVTPSHGAPSPLPTPDSDRSMDPEMVRQDLRELLQKREITRRELQERYLDENAGLNRG